MTPFPINSQTWKFPQEELAIGAIVKKVIVRSEIE
jgi:hypothetical protein